jgi:hypothetical protein
MSQMHREHKQWCKASALAGILMLSLMQQGCLAVAWVAAVGADSLRTSDFIFRPFEQSWVSSEKPTEINESLTSLVVLPVEGDDEMGARLTQILQHQTALQIVGPTKLEREVNALPDDSDRIALAKAISREFDVDAVLFGRVVSSVAHPSDWGWKDEESRRLFLYLLDRDGHLLWKDQLPFTVVTGSKPAIEDSVQTSLSHHLMDHVHDLGLDDLGYLPPKSS